MRCLVPSIVAGPPNYKILQDLGPSTDAEDQEAEDPGMQDSSSSSQTSSSSSSSGAQGEVSGGSKDGAEQASLQREDTEEGGMAPAPGSISILESCLVDWASKSRMRLKVTVRITHDPANGEVEVEVFSDKAIFRRGFHNEHGNEHGWGYTM